MCKAAQIFAEQDAVWSKESLDVDYVEGAEQGGKKQSWCHQCRQFHAPEECPTRGKSRYICKKKNPFAVCCSWHQANQMDEAEVYLDILKISVCTGVTAGAGADWWIRSVSAGQELHFTVGGKSACFLCPTERQSRAQERQF